MKKHKSIKYWSSALLIFMIFLITISFTVAENYKPHFDGSPDCFKSIGGDSICNLEPLNYRVYPACLNVKNNDTISRIELLSADKLECEDKRFEIISFVVGAGGGCVGGYGLYSQTYCGKNNFSENAKYLISVSIKKVSPIFFDCIAAKTKDGKIFLLKPVMYWVKDSPNENNDPAY